ncbi:MAG TPA: family 1 glycosylhydrolase, partial [Gemmatimonadaceae bacterium]|nr:family 1 glycosylhydrolase [Gemmatimonadaceae bacterium]
AGGWANRSIVDAFDGYTDVVARRLGDRVKSWITHNEPWCTSFLGHHNGEHAPGLTDPHQALIVAHHVLLSHGRAVATLRAQVRDARVGIALNLNPAYPASPSEADREAARHYDAFFNRWYLDPVFRGRYPEDGVADKVRDGALPAENPLHFVQPGDLETISAPIDFLGINYYSREISRSRALPEEKNAPRTIPHPPAEVRTDMGWEVYPDGLHDLLVRVHRDYAPRAILITENGAAYAMGPDASGQVPDEPRRAYLEGHLAACHRAIAAGVPLTGYFVWSLLDNFEWAFGYTKRFGVVWVDFATQRRIPKASALWYRDVARANALTLSAAPTGGAR